MRVTRRVFVAGASTSLATLAAPGWLKAFGGAERHGYLEAASGNLFMAFNNIRDVENGESDEYTTIANVQRLLGELQVPQGATIIGIGARSGTAADPLGMPGEMAYHWTYGEPWNGVVTNPLDASPVGLGLDDPIVVSQVGVLREETAHRFVLDGAAAAGRVLWSFYNDETVRPILGRGFHNAFSDVDGGMMETIYKVTRQARAAGGATAAHRRMLQPFLPALADDVLWTAFQASLAKPAVEADWLPYVRAQGWQGAAIVLRGSFTNVAQFHLRQWNRHSPQEPDFQIGRGTHPPLRVLYGRETRPFMDPDTADYTMVGFLWDRQAADCQPPMATWLNDSDIFGHDFHIHGFRDDGRHGGHTLFTMLGQGQLEVKLYPLAFAQDQTAYLFNNDVALLPETLQQTDAGLAVSIRNNGENFLRNVGIRLDGRGSAREDLLIPVLNPRETATLAFPGRAGQQRGERTLTVDFSKHYLEGGAGRANNAVRIAPDMSWRWV